jgi:hypothetical protein
MDQKANKFGDRLYRLERQCGNDQDEVQNRPEQREFNIIRVR